MEPRRLLGICLAWALLGLGAGCGDGEKEGGAGPEGGTAPSAATRPAPATRPSPLAREVTEKLAAQGVHLELERGLIWLAGWVCVLADPLEYVAVGRKGATHESLLVVDCKPSALNAGLLALGLEPGSNFRLEEKIPAPSEEDVRAGRAKPFVLIHPEPKGPTLHLAVEWAGKEGRTVRHRVEDLIRNTRLDGPLPPCPWVYFGGRMAPLYKGEPPVFIADFEENLISACYMDPSNHLITIRHEHGLDQTAWWPNAELLPPRETPVRLYISLDPLP